jgi:hypothetical protein
MVEFPHLISAVVVVMGVEAQEFEDVVVESAQMDGDKNDTMAVVEVDESASNCWDGRVMEWQNWDPQHGTCPETHWDCVPGRPLEPP